MKENKPITIEEVVERTGGFMNEASDIAMAEADGDLKQLIEETDSDDLFDVLSEDEDFSELLEEKQQELFEEWAEENGYELEY